MPFDASNRPTAKPSAQTLAYASARRAELFAALDRVGKCRRNGFKPFELRCLHLDLETIAKANRFAGKVLP